jgi:FkbM family methyltransferase
LKTFFITCLFSAFGLSASNHPDLSLYEKGVQLFRSACGEWDISKIYAEDSRNLHQFPFHHYQIYEVHGQGKFYLDDRPDCIKDVLRKGDTWEMPNLKLMEKYIRPGSIAIDVGAHIGTHTLTMSKCAGEEGTVFAFDPQMKIFCELCMNLSLNGCTNVIPIRCALGKEKNIVQLVHPLSDNEGASFINTNPNVITNKFEESIATITLDSFNLKNVSFIKIDVENFEGDVLDGAINTIRDSYPIIVVEIQGNLVGAAMTGNDMQKMTEDSIKKLEDLGYNLFFMGFDYLAIPKKGIGEVF